MRERSAGWGPVSDLGVELTEPVRLPPFVHEDRFGDT